MASKLFIDEIACFEPIQFSMILKCNVAFKILLLVSSFKEQKEDCREIPKFYILRMHNVLQIVLT